MPPHCDTKDGPVVKAAREALNAANVKIILPYVPKLGEREVEEMFEKVMLVRNTCAGFQAGVELAEEWFFENVVRVHRAGEGAPYSGLKPAGLSEGPVIPIAERAIKTESPDELMETMAKIVKEEVKKRFDKMARLKKRADKSVDDGREYVEAMLGLQVYSHRLYMTAISDPHEKGHEHSREKEVHNH